MQVVSIDPRVDADTRSEVQKVMDLTGMDGMQAYYHVKGRNAALRLDSQRKREAYRAQS